MPLLSPQDPAPFQLINPSGKAPLLLTCEHAGQASPQKLGLLGLEKADFDQHYAYDPGVKQVTQLLSRLLDAPALLGNYSRMVVDLNRPENDMAFPTIGEGKPITGNESLNESDKQARFNEIYHPYYHALDSLLDTHFLANGIIPLIISIHSFTPIFHGEKRPWDMSCLWVQDDRLPNALMDAFTAQGYVVGDNQPYNLKIIRGAMIDRCAVPRKLPNVMVEFRNDLLRSECDISTHTHALAAAIKPLLGRADMHELYDGPDTPYDPKAEKEYMAKVMRTLK